MMVRIVTRNKDDDSLIRYIYGEPDAGLGPITMDISDLQDPANKGWAVNPIRFVSKVLQVGGPGRGLRAVAFSAAAAITSAVDVPVSVSVTGGLLLPFSIRDAIVVSNGKPLPCHSA